MTETDPAGEQGPVPPTRPDVPVVSDHTLIRVIGAGGGGQVWLARNVLGTYRAVKIVHAAAFKDRSPFEREVNGILKFEPVSRLHDGLVDILQVGQNEEAGYFYYVMELADDVKTGQSIVPEKYVARTLSHDVAKHRRLPVGECIRLGAAVASALGFLHRNGLIHRDIKPANIIYVNGFPKLADIGLVVGVSEDKSYVGTEGFIPPEGAGTVKADIYSLGKVLYEISTGKDRRDFPRLPADLKDNAEDRDLIEFNHIVVHACRTDPRNRFKSAEEMMSEILNFQFNAGQARRKRTQNRWVMTIGIIGAIFAASVFGTILWRIVWLLNQE
jgi:eukaryotic-like serine/threonine-protein kinase